LESAKLKAEFDQKVVEAKRTFNQSLKVLHQRLGLLSLMEIGSTASTHPPRRGRPPSKTNVTKADFDANHAKRPERSSGKGKTKRRAHGSFLADCQEAVKRLGKRHVTAKAVMEVLDSMNVKYHANQVYKTLGRMSNLEITTKRTKKQGTRGRASVVYKKVTHKKR
jgi:hypothetical protein